VIQPVELRHDVWLDRDVLQPVELRPGLDGVLKALDSMVAMQTTGPVLLHRWIETRHDAGESWSTLAHALRVARQTAHERFNRPAPRMPSLAGTSRQLWAGVQVARDQAVSAAMRSENDASPATWDWDGWRPQAAGPYQKPSDDDGWPPPRDLDDLVVLRRVLGSIEEELPWLVAEARARGASWAALSRVFRVRRQAVHKRFKASATALLADASHAANRRREFVLKYGFDRVPERPCIFLERELCL
jgi:hypothetical protein